MLHSSNIDYITVTLIKFDRKNDTIYPRGRRAPDVPEREASGLPPARDPTPVLLSDFKPFKNCGKRSNLLAKETACKDVTIRMKNETYCPQSGNYEKTHHGSCFRRSVLCSQLRKYPATLVFDVLTDAIQK